MSAHVLLNLLTLCVLKTLKLVLWQTVKTQMKCHIMWHFIRVCTVCEDKIDLQRKKYNILLDTPKKMKYRKILIKCNAYFKKAVFHSS